MFIRTESGERIEANEKNKARAYVMPAEGTDWTLTIRMKAVDMPKNQNGNQSTRPKSMPEDTFYTVATFDSVEEANAALASYRQTKKIDGAGWDAMEYKAMTSSQASDQQT